MTKHKLVPIEPTKEMLEATSKIEILTGYGDDAVFVDDFEANKLYKAMLEAAPDVGGEAVAWIRKNRFRFNADIEPSDDSEIALFTYPPDAAKRIADLEADKARLVDALKHTKSCLELANLIGVINDTLWSSDTETLFDYMDALLAEMEGKDV